jgi:hypothetical protein
VRHLVAEEHGERTVCGLPPTLDDQRGLEGGIHGVDCTECRRQVSEIVKELLKALRSPD